MHYYPIVLLSLKLATATTLILLAIGTPLAWWLARSRSWLKPVTESLVALPLVLPPTVLGFYLLVLLGASGPFGNLGLAFSFGGLLIGSVIYSLPFVVQPLQNAFQAIEPGLLERAATLGASPLDRFFSVAVPLARRGFVTASILGFAHTLGEFGIVLMIGGNIPGKTQTLSIAIYNQVEQLNYGEAHLMAGGLLLFSLIALLFVFICNQPSRQARL